MAPPELAPELDWANAGPAAATNTAKTAIFPKFFILLSSNDRAGAAWTFLQGNKVGGTGRFILR
jgi:hypothetical protein